MSQPQRVADLVRNTVVEVIANRPAERLQLRSALTRLRKPENDGLGFVVFPFQRALRPCLATARKPKAD
jgi:hypothetical protein